MFLPLHDDVPLRRIAHPVATYGLIVLNMLIWLATSVGRDEHVIQAAAIGFGVGQRVATRIASTEASIGLGSLGLAGRF